MSLLWLFPAGLAALAALLLPLLIHLARRDQQQRIDFAALRWLSAQPRPRRRIRFDEWPLLLVRLLLLALLAVLLARPALSGWVDAAPRVAVLPGVDVAALRSDKDNDRTQWLWLAPGFPAINERGNTPATPQPVASLVRELDATLPAQAPLTIVVPAVLDGWDAERAQLSRRVQWQVVDAPAAASTVTPAKPPVLQVRHDADAASGLRYMHAVQQAWHPQTALDSGNDTQAFTAKDHVVRLWLSSNPLPPELIAWAGNGGRLLVDARTPVPANTQRLSLWRDDATDGLLLERISTGDGQWLRWASALDPALIPALLDPSFPSQLQLHLQPAPTPRRALAESLHPDTGGAAYPQPARELAPGLVLAIALLFLLERWLASAPRRRRPA